MSPSGRILALKHWIGLDRRRHVDIDAIASADRHENEQASRPRDCTGRGNAPEKQETACCRCRPTGHLRIAAALPGTPEDDRSEVDRPSSPATSEPFGAYFSQLLRRRLPGTEYSASPGERRTRPDDR